MASGTATQAIAGGWQQRFANTRWFAFGLGFLLLVVSVQYAFKLVSSHEINRSAFHRWRDQVLHLSDENIYQRYAYPNPPIMAMVLEPLAQLPPLVGSLSWFFVKVGLTVLAVHWVFAVVEMPDRPFPRGAKILTVLLSLRPIMGDLSHGNVNLFILFLLAGALLAFHRGRDFVSGITLALAIACKVTPALFIPYFAWKRAWRTLAGCVVGLVLFLIIVPGFRVGMQRNLLLLDSWYHQMVTPYVVNEIVTSDHLNQSLPALVLRLITESPSYQDASLNPLRYDNIWSFSRRTAGLLVKGCMLCFSLLVVWSCRTPLRPRASWRLAAEFSLVVLGMLLFSERTWKHHCVTLVFPFAVISYAAYVLPAGRLLRAYLLGSLAVVLALMLSTSTGTGEHLDGFGKLMQVYGAYVWAYFILIAALVVLLRSGLEESRNSQLTLSGTHL